MTSNRLGVGFSFEERPHDLERFTRLMADAYRTRLLEAMESNPAAREFVFELRFNK